MPISIVANTSAEVAHTNLSAANQRLIDANNRISSGQRVFNAKDDAAALAIGSGLRVDASGLRAAQINVQQGISMLQIADGALGQLTNINVRMEELASQSLSDQLSNTERVALDVEYQELLEEMDRIVDTTEFNGNLLLGGAASTVLNTAGANVDTDDGFVGFEFEPKATPGDVFTVDYFAATQAMTITNATQSISQTIFVSSPQVGALSNYEFSTLGVTITLNSDFDDTTDVVHAGAGEEFDVVAGAAPAASALEFQVGLTTAPGDKIAVNLPLLNTTQLGLDVTSVGTSNDANAAKIAIRAAQETLNAARSQLGANVNRMEVAASNLATSLENTESGRSSMLDVDVASEISTVATQQALVEAGVNMLTRANQQPELLLQLLRG